MADKNSGGSNKESKATVDMKKTTKNQSIKNDHVRKELNYPVGGLVSPMCYPGVVPAYKGGICGAAAVSLGAGGVHPPICRGFDDNNESA